MRQLFITGIACFVGLAPMIADNIQYPGHTFSEVFTVGTNNGPLVTSPLRMAHRLVNQLVATLSVGIPRLLGSETICPKCSHWPTASAPADAIFVGSFSLFALVVWLIAAVPLARDLYQLLLARRSGRTLAVTPWDDPRWWGRAMLVGASGLTVLAYVASAQSYDSPLASVRFLIGLYVCAPLAIAPLVAGVEKVWRYVYSAARPPATDKQSFSQLALASLATALLAAIFGLNIAGAAQSFAATADTQTYGVPSGQRDANLINFLQAHQATRFYTQYWTCYRIAFEANGQVICAVTLDSSAFIHGLDRETDFQTAVDATPHPAYVFDTTFTETLEAQAQVATAFAQHDPRFNGYATASFDNFVIFYYAG
jgi:hypothetical protein